MQKNSRHWHKYRTCMGPSNKNCSLNSRSDSPLNFTLPTRGIHSPCVKKCPDLPAHSTLLRGQVLSTHLLSKISQENGQGFVISTANCPWPQPCTSEMQFLQLKLLDPRPPFMNDHQKLDRSHSSVYAGGHHEKPHMQVYDPQQAITDLTSFGISQTIFLISQNRLWLHFQPGAYISTSTNGPQFLAFVGPLIIREGSDEKITLSLCYNCTQKVVCLHFSHAIQICHTELSRQRVLGL